MNRVRADSTEETGLPMEQWTQYILNFQRPPLQNFLS